MPLEIKEIVITASVTENGASGASSVGADSARISNKEDIIKECVEQVLEILREKNER
jgi:hypothetical protein